MNKSNHKVKSRRNFFNNLLGVSVATLVPVTAMATTKNTSTNNPIIKPKRLKKGATVGLIAPGYAVKNEVLEHAKATLKKMGFVPFHTDRIKWNHGYFSNTDQERADDLNEMFANPNIDAILCARGGYGCTRIMQLIDYDSIKNNPKILIGFSDITALLNGIYQETGLVTFHGPVGSTLDDEYSIQQLKNILVNPKNKTLIQNVVLKADRKELSNPEFERYTITPGTATGKIVGGSLTLINALIGTAHEIDFTNKIVCIEDVEEPPYRIDRMLTQLIEGKTFKNASAIVIGVCSGCDKKPKPGSFTLKEVILNRIQHLNLPSAYGMSFGHVTNNFTFPIGIEATFNADTMTIELLENAVS
ncbi:LD-carboxypeptidase [Cellulophaga baltica]|uniref:S66 peptidase family protein n=1 Tax=Cellulophaga TaxID=104264 RepID=UPI001C0775F2|nr:MULTISPECIES: LD-carboxypeptidase [Cellulophaga]MBU2996545.1 LD-carboxypeptidase [Cellulophaga baltica]MDO6767939.1 LD-carboxypeptidase [Cellulophaga sp. 1_MG-2023]